MLFFVASLEVQIKVCYDADVFLLLWFCSSLSIISLDRSQGPSKCLFEYMCLYKNQNSLEFTYMNRSNNFSYFIQS